MGSVSGTASRSRRQGIKTLAFDLGQNKDNLVVVLGAVANGKPIISCYISKALVAEREWDAGKIVRSLGQHIKGGGVASPFLLRQAVVTHKV